MLCSQLCHVETHVECVTVLSLASGLPWCLSPYLTALSLLSPSGGLDLAIEGPSKAEISCIDNKDGTCTVTYLPTLPGDYSILVKYNDKHIPGSPFTAKITGRVVWLSGSFLTRGIAAPTATHCIRSQVASFASVLV